MPSIRNLAFLCANAIVMLACGTIVAGGALGLIVFITILLLARWLEGVELPYRDGQGFLEMLQGAAELLAPLTQDQQAVLTVHIQKSGLLSQLGAFTKVLVGKQISPPPANLKKGVHQTAEFGATDVLLVLRSLFGLLRLTSSLSASVLLRAIEEPHESTAQMVQLSMQAMANVTPPDAPLTKTSLMDSILAAGQIERTYIELLWRSADPGTTGAISCQQFALACLRSEPPSSRRQQSFDALAVNSSSVSHEQLSIWLAIGLAKGVELERLLTKQPTEEVSELAWIHELSAFSQQHRAAVDQVAQLHGSLPDASIKREQLQCIAAQVERQLCAQHRVIIGAGWSKAEFMRLSGPEVLDVDLPGALFGLFVMPRWLMIEKYQFFKEKLGALRPEAHREPGDGSWSEMAAIALSLLGWLPTRLLPSKL